MNQTHDLTGITKVIWADPNGDVWIIHHQPDVREGDLVLLGRDYMTGKRFVVLANLQAYTVIEQWTSRVRRSPPTIYVAGFTFSASRPSLTSPAP